MLRSLHIENVAVIERADIELGPGFCVLTGETGAGKSIIIDALGAVIGGRVSKEIVRTGCASAFVSAEFSVNGGITAWLAKNELEAEEETLVVSRKVSADGKSSCRVNGVPVSAAQLRALGAWLVDIHGQNDGQKLLAEANHRAYLDRFGTEPKLLASYRESYKLWLIKTRAEEELHRLEQGRELRVEELTRVIEEISAVNPKPDEQDELLRRRALIRSSEKLTSGVNGAINSLKPDALDALHNAEGFLSTAARFDESLLNVLERYKAARIETEDIAEFLTDYIENFDFSPDELDTIETRIANLQRIERRYGAVEESLARLETARTELATISGLDEQIALAKAETSEAYKTLMVVGAELTAARKTAAEKLSLKICTELAELSMPGARFSVEFDEFLQKPNEHGFEDLRFVMSANAGETLGRISKIASGGELSRIMLALKSVLPGDADTQVFDEIDTGVSGIAASKVAAKLREISANKQVLCITHLPQLASAAGEHFLISKEEAGGRTFTSVTRLDAEAHKAELSRLVGGDEILRQLTNNS
ncbi:MAG: DNA repair protein RecN [Oscillospiraceae bacterium]|nr:DNA repair protein RecN [Oscillospiraceae bacterium]